MAIGPPLGSIEGAVLAPGPRDPGPQSVLRQLVIILTQVPGPPRRTLLPCLPMGARGRLRPHLAGVRCQPSLEILWRDNRARRSPPSSALLRFRPKGLAYLGDRWPRHRLWQTPHPGRRWARNLLRAPCPLGGQSALRRLVIIPTQALGRPHQLWSRPGIISPIPGLRSVRRSFQYRISSCPTPFSLSRQFPKLASSGPVLQWRQPSPGFSATTSSRFQWFPRPGSFGPVHRWPRPFLLLGLAHSVASGPRRRVGLQWRPSAAADSMVWAVVDSTAWAAAVAAMVAAEGMVVAVVAAIASP